MPQQNRPQTANFEERRSNQDRRDPEQRWVVAGVSEHIRTAMRDAARREGVTLGTWMERVLGTIMEAAEAEGVSFEDWIYTVRGRPKDAPARSPATSRRAATSRPSRFHC